MGRKLVGLPALRRALVALAVASAVLAAAPVAHGQEPAPAVTVPVDSGGGSAPAPAPDPAPSADDASQGGDSGGGSSSGPAPAPSADPPAAEAPASDEAAPAERVEAGPSAEEKTKEKKRRRQEQARQEQEEQEQATAEATAIAAAATERNEGPFAGGAITTSAPGASVEDVALTPSEEAEPEGEATQTAIALPVAFSDEKESSALPGAAPVLLGLLALSIVLLGLAAVPPWRIRADALAGLVSGRRLELGLVGAAVLACAVVGLLVTVLAG